MYLRVKYFVGTLCALISLRCSFYSNAHLKFQSRRSHALVDKKFFHSCL